VCWLCDHPGATELDYQDHLRQLIDTFGWAVQGVEREFYGRRIRGLQLVHADKRGRWPWDRAYQSARGGQPVLGPREPPQRRKRVE
jgi:hypothetical protein